MTALHILSGDLFAGKEYQVVALMTGMRELGSPGRALLFNEGDAARQLRSAGCEVTIMDEKCGLVSLVIRALKLPRADVIISHDYKEACLGLILALFNRSALITVHHGKLEHKASIKGRFSNWLHLLISRYFSKRVVFVSEDLRRRLGFEGGARARVIHNSLVESSANDGASTEGAGQIVFCGRLVHVKRVDLTIRSFKRALTSIPTDTSLLIIGDGPKRSELQQLAASEGIADRVRFLGYRPDARSIIAGARALVISSEHEGIPTVMLEAMRAEVPVVATAVGGIVEIARLFPNFPISLVSSGDIEALSKALVSFAVAEYPSANGISSSDRERFHSYFNPRRLAQDYLNVLSEIA